PSQHTQIAIHGGHGQAAPTAGAFQPGPGDPLMNCDPMRERLAVWLYGDVPPDEAARRQQHVRDGPACQGENAVRRRMGQAVDAGPAREIDTDVAGLYGAASRSSQRNSRRWRRTAMGLTAALAGSLLVIVCTSVEIRCDGNQLVVRWGAAPSSAS